MAYSDFDLIKVRRDFGLQIDEQPDLFADVPSVQPSATLAHILIETAHLAIAINTAKARSEMLITPVLLDIWRQAQSQISLFSGTEFHVDEARGLTGYCDYILSRSKEQLTINVPVVMIVEAKNENIKGGLLAIRPINFPYSEFQADGKEKPPTPVVAKCPAALMTEA